MKMTCCGSVYELDPEVGRDILAGRQVEITRKDLTLCQRGNGSGGSWQDEGGKRSRRTDPQALQPVRV